MIDVALRRPVVSGRVWAYIGLVLGGAVSIAANVLHSFVPPAGQPAGWTPDPFAVAFAVFWPVALFVAIEILARTDWGTAWRWVLLRFAGLGPVAAIAAFVSYRHLSALLAHYGEDAVTVAVGPLAVDGLMVMATSALIATTVHQTIEAATVGTAAEPSPSGAEMDAWWPELAQSWAHQLELLDADDRVAELEQQRVLAEREAARAQALHAADRRAQRRWRDRMLTRLAEAFRVSGQRPTDDEVRLWMLHQAEETGVVPSRADTREFWQPAPGSTVIDQLRVDVAQALAERVAGEAAPR